MYVRELPSVCNHTGVQMNMNINPYIITKKLFLYIKVVDIQMLPYLTKYTHSTQFLISVILTISR